MALVIDTGPLLAALDTADPDHPACAALLVEATEDLVVPALVLAELDYWCARRLPPHAWLTFLDDVIDGAYRIEPPNARDLALGVVDATVIALTERLQEPKVATLDHRHFRAVRPEHVEALELRP